MSNTQYPYFPALDCHLVEGWLIDNTNGWDSSDPSSHEGTCDRCGRQTIVQTLEDPYLSELYPEDPAEIAEWCGGCWTERQEQL